MIDYRLENILGAYFKRLLWCSTIAVASYFASSCLLPNPVMAADIVDLNSIHNWKDLKEDPSIKSGHDLHYYHFKSVNGSDIHLVVAEFGKHHLFLKPVVNRPKGSTSQAALSEGAVAAVNGGYFNLSNGESASYVTINGKLECDAALNKALTTNEKLKPFLPAIFDRSELRIVSDTGGDLRIRIVNHNAALDKGETLVHALQAGPQLLPLLTEEKEAFVRVGKDGKQVDSIGARLTAARTAFGVTSDQKYIMLICVSSKRQDEFSEGVTLAQMAGMLKALGCAQALNLDGGTSSTMVVKDAEHGYKMVCGRNPETLVKSVLSIYKP